ncbi:cation:proton antiporter [Azospirillum halopraeferens]|uniref:cation:proton antiporter n=1 Tax=Azospirillum halopraeferens TaxID=34010 RepID=UPI000401B75B|nr:cation:proton antiporter [Azospirillum halopraeferens]
MHPIVFYVLGVAGLLALVSFLPPLAVRLRLPYTVLLAGVGLALGALVQVGTAADGAGPVGDFLDSLAEFDLSYETLLHLFLPVLLFETALAINVRRLMDDIGPILVLAVVAVFACTFAIGLALNAVTSMGLVACLLLGSILATTDPAAVIGIFRDLGAPRRLNMLVEGESLLNDAAAIALFTLLLGLLTRQGEGGVAEAGLAFVRAFAGGMLVGWACGRVACLLVTPMREQPMAEITLTVALAYLSYVLAEHYVGVSGVVAVVAAALVVGSVGRTRISPETWGALANVWRQLGFWANALIFLLTALFVPQIFAGFGWYEAGLVAVVVAAALVSRAAVLFGLLPVLSLAGLGQQVSHAYKLVMLWGGLRGAVSLTLVLAVTQNANVPAEVQGFVAPLAAGFVFFSLFVNGTTLRWLIRLLGLDRLTPMERAMRNRALALAMADIRERIGAVARQYETDPVAADTLLEHYTARRHEIDRDRRGEAELTTEDRVTIGLVILAAREEELYFHHFTEGITSRTVVELLSSRAAQIQDAVRLRRREGYRALDESIIAFSPWMRLASWLHRHFGIQAPLARRLSLRFELLMAVRLVLRELRTFNGERLAQVLGHDIAVELEALLALRLDEVEQALAALRLQYPDYAVVLQNQYLGRAALRMEEADYAQLYAEQIISQEVLNDLRRELAARRRILEQPARLDLRLDKAEMVSRVPIFAGLAAERVAAIARLLRPRLVLPGEMVVRRGDRGDAMFFIASGAVEVLVPGLAEPVHLGTGEVFGEMALLARQPRNADVRALGYCQLLVLDEKDFRRTVRSDPHLRAHIEAVAAARRNPPPRAEPASAQPAPSEQAAHG